MKTLDDLNPKIKQLLTSPNEGDIRIGAELLIMENLSEEELLYMLPERVIGDSRRDIKSNYSEYMEIPLSDNIRLIITTNWLSISSNK